MNEKRSNSYRLFVWALNCAQTNVNRRWDYESNTDLEEAREAVALLERIQEKVSDGFTITHVETPVVVTPTQVSLALYSARWNLAVKTVAHSDGIYYIKLVSHDQSLDQLVVVEEAVIRDGHAMTGRVYNTGQKPEFGGEYFPSDDMNHVIHGYCRPSLDQRLTVSTVNEVKLFELFLTCRDFVRGRSGHADLKQAVRGCQI